MLKTMLAVMALLAPLVACGETKVHKAQVEATGTPSSTTYLRGDGAWSAPSLPVEQIQATGTPSSATYLRGDGTWTGTAITNVAGSSIADQSNSNNAAWVSIGNANFTAEANSTYAFEFWIVSRSSDATSGIAVNLHAPASPAVLTWEYEYWSSTSDHAYATSSAAGAVTPLNSQGSVYLLSIVRGALTTGAIPGDVSLDFRPEVNGVTVDVLRGSHVKWVKF